jgi:beta-phosphoglucomutase-like phosphatase (HAD superfamily)
LYRALLFDLDGTLAETDSLHLPTWADALRPHGVEIDEHFFRQNISGRSNAKIVRDLLPDLSVEDARPDRSPGVELPRARPRARTAPRPRGLHGGGQVPRPLAGAPHQRAERERRGGTARARAPRVLRRGGALRRGRQRQARPGPLQGGPRESRRRPAEALAFEDSTSGIASAVGAGIPTVGIASTQAPETLEEAGAVMVAEHFADPELGKLLNLVQRRA